MTIHQEQLKVACVTCYFDPDYVRSRTIRAALSRQKDLRLLVCKNKHRGMLRYPEMILRLLKLRFIERPDAYVLTFRGQELLPFLLITAGRRPVVFDEFLVPLAWSNQEKHAATATIRLQRLLSRSLAPLYKRWLARCHTILADTVPHADESAQLSGVPRSRYLPLPVGADEDMFYPAMEPTANSAKRPYEVFFCGNMRPLYGLEYVLRAATELKTEPVHFTIVGGDAQAEASVRAARADGAHITYRSWLPFEALPQAMPAADIGLTQYGDTPQARRVISGKAYQMLACALPIILGASQASTMFKHKHNCLLIPQADSTALTEAIRWAYMHPEQMERIGMAGRALYEERFSTKALAAVLRPLVKTLAGVQRQRNQK